MFVDGDKKRMNTIMSGFVQHLAWRPYSGRVIAPSESSDLLSDSVISSLFFVFTTFRRMLRWRIAARMRVYAFASMPPRRNEVEAVIPVHGVRSPFEQDVGVHRLDFFVKPFDKIVGKLNICGTETLDAVNEQLPRCRRIAKQLLM